MQIKKFLKENWTLIFTILYILSPIDLIPEFLAPILGPFIFSDDFFIVLVEVVRRYRNSKKEAATKNAAEGRTVIEGEVIN